MLSQRGLFAHAVDRRRVLAYAHVVVSVPARALDRRGASQQQESPGRPRGDDARDEVAQIGTDARCIRQSDVDRYRDSTTAEFARSDFRCQRRVRHESFGFGYRCGATVMYPFATRAVSTSPDPGRLGPTPQTL